MRAMGSGALLGLTGSVGVLLMMWWLAARRPVRVAARIHPHVAAGPRADAAGYVVSTLSGLVLPHRRRSGGAGLRGRLTRAGSTDSPSHYRLEQVAWATLGAFAVGMGAVVVDAPIPVGVLALALVGAMLGVLARDWSLARQASRRRERIEEHLPAVAELLAFAVAAGESPHGALVRVSQSLDGDLSVEIERVVADVRSGLPLESSLRSLVDRTASPTVGRFVDGLVLAIERGTPLADVLRAQASDARSDSRRRLMELAGRKDVAMLIPVVFLILPTVIAIALYPGIQGLRLVAP